MAVKVFTVCEKYQDNVLLVEKLLVEVAEGGQQFDNLKGRSPNCLALQYVLHCCLSGLSTMAVSLQADSPQMCTHCRCHHRIGKGTHIVCSDLHLLL